MAIIERVYIVPLRKGFRETEEYRKTKKAVATLKAFLKRHMKQEDDKKIRIGKNLNKELWKHGIKNPPAKVKIVVIKEDDGTVKAELFGFKYEHKKKDKTAKPEKGSIAEKLEAVKGKKKEDKDDKETTETAEDKPKKVLPKKKVAPKKTE